jgi:hypothetical protein
MILVYRKKHRWPDKARYARTVAQKGLFFMFENRGNAVNSDKQNG